MVAWNAVSKTATCGTPGSARLASWSAANAGALWSGASSRSSSKADSTSSSTTTGVRKRSPPCTILWATAATSSGACSIESSGSEAPLLSTVESLTLVEPAFTTRTRLMPCVSALPGPVADRRVVLAVLSRVRASTQAGVVHLLADVAGPAAEPRHPVDHVDDEMEPVEVVQHHHVERRRRRSFLLVAAHMEVVVVSAAVREAVDQPRVAVVGEDDGAVRGEERVELRVGEPVRMLALRLQAHQVDDVHDPDLELGQVLAEERGRGERLERRDVAAAREDDVGIVVAVGRRPLPDAEAAGAVHDRVVHREVVERRLLARDDHVHIVTAAQAVVGDGQERVRVRREIDADDLGLLVHHVVDEAGVLMREAVVVLPPHVGGEEVVERGDRPPPGDVARHLQPLRVLVEHRVDDVDERLVTVEETVPARQEIPPEPALAEVLRQDFHDPPVGSELLVGRLRLRVPRAARDREDVVEPVRRGLVGTEQTERLAVAGDHV